MYRNKKIETWRNQRSLERPYLFPLCVYRGNIPAGAVQSGEELCHYLPPFPAKGTGFHRYIYVLFKQEGQIDFQEDARSSPWWANLSINLHIWSWEDFICHLYICKCWVLLCLHSVAIFEALITKTKAANRRWSKVASLNDSVGVNKTRQ